MKARAREMDPITFEAFLELEKKDRGDTEAPYGQQNGKTLKMVDYELLNEGSKEDLTQTVNEFLERNLRFSAPK
jgi:hypothetical protein